MVDAVQKEDVLLGNGAGSFALSATIPVCVEPRGIATGDFDQDGKPDLVVNAESDNTLTVLTNSCGP